VEVRTQRKARKYHRVKKINNILLLLLLSSHSGAAVSFFQQEHHFFLRPIQSFREFNGSTGNDKTTDSLAMWQW
jgi:hypothetical protein